ncbi:MAG: NUDIX hydrolase [Candidatus Carbobacillus altaicus]|nr:NUDIX hydrolase [Candidatus Carbobacillus altaicus]
MRALDVAAGGVVIEWRDGEPYVLLIADRFGRITLPKGHLENGETLEQAAVREVQEETGLRARIVRFLGETRYAFTDPSGGVIDKVVHYYLMAVSGGTLKAQLEEIDGVQWVKANDVLALQDERGYPNNRPIIEAALAYVSTHPSFS